MNFRIALSCFISNNRSRADQYLNSRLQGDLQIGLLRGFLELDISEMTDPNIEMRFHDAQRLMDEQGVTMFTKQLAIIGSLTSIAACSATLATLVNRKSWPVLALMASMPLLNKLTVPLLMMFKNQELRTNSHCETDCSTLQSSSTRIGVNSAREAKVGEDCPGQRRT